MHLGFLISGLLTLAFAGTLAALYTGDYLALEDHRLPTVRWAWFDTNPDHFQPAVRSQVLRVQRLFVGAAIATLSAVILLWLAFA